MENNFFNATNGLKTDLKTASKPERLQKILANYGISSRRGAEEIILAGRVMVNNQVIASLGTKADPSCDQIAIDGIPISQKPALEYLLLNKPKGFICSRHDPQGRKTIQTLLPSQFQHLYSVGRLDYDSSGALLLTNDGDFANRLIHPRHHVAKVYRVLVNGIVSAQIIEKWRAGIDLDGKITLPAEVEILTSHSTSTTLRITLHEGRNRQIRRVGEILGHSVLDLHREAFATINLGNLSPKSYRHLSLDELLSLGIKS